jgi:hypothetical protein
VSHLKPFGDILRAYTVVIIEARQPRNIANKSFRDSLHQRPPGLVVIRN